MDRAGETKVGYKVTQMSHPILKIEQPMKKGKDFFLLIFILPLGN